MLRCMLSCSTPGKPGLSELRMYGDSVYLIVACFRWHHHVSNSDVRWLVFGHNGDHHSMGVITGNTSFGGLDMCYNIEFNHMIIDNTCMQLVSKPQQFDVIVLPNLYGNIVGNVAAGLVGGAGLTTGINLGPQNALFEMGTRNSGRSLAGKNIANPCGMLLTSADMLDYLDHSREAELIREAVVYVIGEQRIRTADLGGDSKTSKVIEAVLKRLKSRMAL
ncbi:unnamed protein product [Trichobilharzia regenti]|nr:unnamed protein product [Trichobilharzia regenti]